ncbi:MAG: SemiSWEET family sugar transporter [Burkholderiales bacterium]|nr:SemiSWEET family sugar transporter [Pseudomonadota bacterium]MCC7069465.1 SemiSWEET family sugar transporter [Burkholderiales bacterium]MCZ2135816.1 SemiSWEET transporter [Burkholderiales bacterium]
MTYETIGLMAGTLTTASFLPQVWKIWKTRSARDLSWGMTGVFCVGVALWLVYGVLLGAPSIIIANAITFVLSLAICIMKYQFDQRDIGDPR